MKRLPDDALPPAIHSAHCRAELALGFADDAGTTRLIERRHFGPLRVQKPLYPESPTVCHAIVVHPPGGVVGGDELRIATRVGTNAAAFLTTPGASKWYKANNNLSRQQVSLEVGAGAALEWLPQETIFFDAAEVKLEHTVELAEDACYIGGEILCFGRTASGESFRSGRITQSTAIRRAGRLIWFEQGVIDAGASLQSPIGLAGHTVCATLIAAGAPLPTGIAGQLRNACEDAAGFGATQMKSLVVARYLGDSSEQAKQIMIRAWQLLRPLVLGREAVIPRIWNT